MNTKPTFQTLALAAFLLAIVSSQFSTARAQGTAFTYQGQLQVGGSPAGGNFDFTFSLFDNNGTNTGQFSATQTNLNVGVTNGLFTVVLDFGANFPGANRWLSIAVRTNGGSGFTAVNPLQQLTPSPYAITAGSVSGQVASSQLTGTISGTNIQAGTITTASLAAGSVTAAQLAPGSVTSNSVAPGSLTVAQLGTALLARLATTITNLTFTNLGTSVVAVGTNKLLALFGSPGAIFDLQGNLTLTITNPEPQVGDNFGSARAAVGDGAVIVGADRSFQSAADSGVAYLFNVSGTGGRIFVSTELSIPFGRFGSAVTGVGSNMVLIGASSEPDNARHGNAYLFQTNGTLIHTFANTFGVSDFGGIVAPFGSDRVVIGCKPDPDQGPGFGPAFLFSTNGTLLATFPGGRTAAAVGSDKLLLGVSLYDTNANLLATYTNGTTAVPLDANRILVGNSAAYTNTGEAYILDLAGDLLLTITNPAPATNDLFGASVAALDSKHIAIGAPGDDTAGTNAGAIYIFEITAGLPGLAGDGVWAGTIETSSIADGAVTAAKLDPSVGVWTAFGPNIYRGSGNVGIQKTNPATALDVNGTVTATGFSGSGAGLTNVNAASLRGLAVSNMWQSSGNNVSPGQFLGSTNYQPLELQVNSLRAMRYEPTTNDANHSNIVNVIGGSPGNVISNGIYGATISGGGAASYFNVGSSNVVFADFGIVAGGYHNTSNGVAAAVGGGHFNVSSGSDSTVAGGAGNTASADDAIVGGGSGNSSTAVNATVGGGFDNMSTNLYATVPGGYGNLAGGTYSLAAGQFARALHSGAFIWADSQSLTFSSSANNQFLIRAQGGVGIGKNNPATALDVNGTVTAIAFSGGGAALTGLNGGNLNSGSVDASRLSSSIGVWSTSGANIFFSGGRVGVNTNTPSSALHVVSPSGDCEISFQSGDPGGHRWTIQSSGSNQNAATFQIVDRTASFSRLLIDTVGHVGIGVTTVTNTHLIDTVSGAFLTTAGVWSSVSDRNVKEKISAIDSREILARVASLPITQWKYKVEADGIKHIGPMAQDFHAAFGLGDSDKAIGSVDEEGVALAAIKALNDKVSEKDAEIQTLKQKAEKVDALEKRMAELEQIVRTMSGKDHAATGN